MLPYATHLYTYTGYTYAIIDLNIMYESKENLYHSFLSENQTQRSYPNEVTITTKALLRFKYKISMILGKTVS